MSPDATDSGSTGPGTTDSHKTTTEPTQEDDRERVEDDRERVAHEGGVPVVVRVVCLVGGLSALLTYAAGVYYWWQAPIAHSLGGAALLVVAAAQAGAMYGLWHARPWAWIVTMVVFPVATLTEVLRLLSGDPSATYALLGDLVVVGYVSNHRERYAPDLRVFPE